MHLHLYCYVHLESGIHGAATKLWLWGLVEFMWFALKSIQAFKEPGLLFFGTSELEFHPNILIGQVLI